MSITFAVDDVTPATEPLATRSLAAGFTSLVSRRLDIVSHETELVRDMPGLHGLAAAVELAFLDHRPLSLSPDDVWLTLVQGFGHHIEHNAEALRERLVRHEDKRVIQARCSSTPKASWSRAP